MGTSTAQLTDKQIAFIEAQHVFFVGTAARDGRVNVSPKGMDSLRVVNAHQIAWLNLTGSGNETAAHLLDQPRMTLMWCAFTGAPQILRAYGQAQMCQPGDSDWAKWQELFPPLPGQRQVFKLDIELVLSSCGMGVPRFSFEEDRQDLIQYWDRQGEAGVQRYQQAKNHHSLDGKPTGLPLLFLGEDSQEA